MSLLAIGGLAAYVIVGLALFFWSLADPFRHDEDSALQIGLQCILWLPFVIAGLVLMLIEMAGEAKHRRR